MTDQDLHICMQELKTSLKYIENEQKDISKRNDEDHRLIKKTIEDWIREADERYAPAWVADSMKFVIAAVALSVIGAFLSLIFKY